MKMCMDHWGKLRAAVADRGLDRFVARDGREAAARLVGEHATEAANFDPLMGAHNLIVSAALDKLGIELMIGDKCPLCELQAKHNEGCEDPTCTWRFETTWIPGPVEVMYQEAVRLKLVGAA